MSHMSAAIVLPKYQKRTLGELRNKAREIRTFPAPLSMKLSSILARRTLRLLRPGTTPMMRIHSLRMSFQLRPECFHCHIIRSASSHSWTVLGIGRPLPLRLSNALAFSERALASAPLVFPLGLEEASLYERGFLVDVLVEMG